VRPVAPRVGLPEVMVAEEQHDYAPLAAAVVRFSDGIVGLQTRWTFTSEERKAIARGEDLYLFVMTHGRPLQPVKLEVGPPDWTYTEEDGS